MGVFSDHKNQITCIYNSSKSTNRQTLGYLKPSERSIRSIDLQKEKLTGTQWVELTKRLGLEFSNLIDTENLEGDINLKAISDEDCITILQNNPNVLSGTIVFNRDKALLIKNPTDALQFIEPDSKSIEKPYN